VGTLRDRVGQFDDDSVIYRADDPQQKVHWRRLVVAYVIGSCLAGLLMAVGARVIGELAAAVTLLVFTIAVTAAYIVWRRRRNERLTGSPTTWPRS
jgi:Flp pilus assembly protein TadB